MQGGQLEDDPTTAVSTGAEKEKFDREALQVIVTSSQRQERGNHPAIQAIDFDRFAESWNEDVSETKRNAIAGRLQVDRDPSDKINRKSPGDVQNVWTKSKKGVNVKRTMEGHRANMSQLRTQHRVELIRHPAASDGGDDSPVAFGKTRDGDTIVFPRVADVQMARIGPTPCAFACAGFNAQEFEGGQHEVDNDSDIDVESGGVGDDSGTGGGGAGSAIQAEVRPELPASGLRDECGVLPRLGIQRTRFHLKCVAHCGQYCPGLGSVNRRLISGRLRTQQY